MRGQKEAEVAAVEAREKKAEIARAKLARDARATQINEAVNARLAAARDVEGFKWDRPHTGREIAAILIGGFAAGLGNVAAIQAGHAPSNQNEGLKGINDRMKREYDAKRARLAQAGDNVLMARHGAKDAQEAHRAAMNDLDADFAARYRAIAREADEQLRRAGVPEAQVKGNVVLVDALQKAAAHEGDIHNREEGHRDQRQQAAATLALARANLGERKREFDDRLADKKLAREEKKESKSLQDQARVDGIVQKVIQNTGYKESAAQNAKYNQMARTLSGATTNAALAAAGAGQFVKMAQGGTGVISDSDMDLFWKRVGGKLSGAAVDQFINDWTNGNMAPAKAKIVGDAIRQLAKGALAELDRIGGQIETRLQGVAENTPWVAKEIPVYLDTYVPGMRQRRTAAAGSTITAPGGIKYELGADGKYHKVK
jgi:hypothetical protein